MQMIPTVFPRETLSSSEGLQEQAAEEADYLCFPYTNLSSSYQKGISGQPSTSWAAR